MTQGQARYETIFVVPATGVRTGRRQFCALAKHLEQPVIVQREIVRVDCVEVLLDTPARQSDGAIGKFPHDLLGIRSRPEAVAYALGVTPRAVAVKAHAAQCMNSRRESPMLFKGVSPSKLLSPPIQWRR